MREEERDWEGAAERLLHSFGLSLLVPDAHYAGVAEWVDRTHLGRPAGLLSRAPGARARDDLRRRCTATRWRASWPIKPDSPFYDWLERELARRFDYACCDDPGAVPPRARGPSPAPARSRAAGERHEKDDRHRLDDRTPLCAGLDQRGQDRRAEAEAPHLEGACSSSAPSASADLQDEQQDASTSGWRPCSSSSVFDDFGELDWRPLALEIERAARSEQRRSKQAPTCCADSASAARRRGGRDRWPSRGAS